MAESDTFVSGRIWFDERSPKFGGATLRLRLEEVSRADAPATEIARLEIADCTHSPGDPPLPFRLSAPSIDPQRRYEVRAHLDLNKSGDLSPGDQVTTQSYPVLTRGYPNSVDLHLHRID